MIRAVQIPKTVSRMGCAPGGGCCDECGGGNLSGTHSYRIETPLGEGTRNSSLHAHLGDVSCDQDGNCYDTTTGALMSAPLTTTAGCAPGVSGCAAASTIGGMNSLYVIGGLALLAFIAMSSGGKRR